MSHKTIRPLQAGEVGRQLEFVTDVNLAGATLVARVAVMGQAATRDLPLAAAADPTDEVPGRQRIAYRLTQASDFAVPGVYRVQVIATWEPDGQYPNGRTWKSHEAEYKITVRGNLNQPTP